MGNVARSIESLLTKDEFDSRLAEHGVEVSSHDVRNWRTRGIMPVAPQGGLARYTPDSVDQALEIQRLASLNERTEYIGWELWWRGFDVDQQYWRHVFESRGRVGFEIIRASVKLLASGLGPKAQSLEAGYRDTIDAVLMFAGQEIEGAAPSESATGAVYGLFQDVAASAHPPLMSTLLFKGDQREAMFDARDDIRLAFQAAAKLHDAMDILFGARAIAQRSARWFGERATKETRAELVLLWMAAKPERVAPGSEQDPIDFAAAAASAETLAARAEALRDLLKSNGRLAAIATPHRLRAAAADPKAKDWLLDEIRRRV